MTIGGDQLVHTFEVWDYRFPDSRILPVILEQRIETPTTVDEQRVASSETKVVTLELFEIPDDFSVR